jgi:hypothetical protein
VTKYLKKKQTRKGLFGLIVSEASAHGWLSSIAFSSVARQEHHGKRAWWMKTAHLMAARQQKR